MGDRLSQTVNAAETRYVLDPGAGLTQVLADGSSTYLYGAGRIAQYQTAMQYFGADGLGSVRQLYNSSGQIVANTRYDPFGSVISQSGTATSAYGFTGEWTDGTGLVNLRARYYAPWQGRFVTRDVWPGHYQRPLTLNGWNYVEGNPVNRTDPSGALTCFPGVIGFAMLPESFQPEFLTVGQAIELCRMQYSKLTGLAFANAVSLPAQGLRAQVQGWENLERCMGWRRWSLPETVSELYLDWLCEQGPEEIYFGGTHRLTQELAQSGILDAVRRKFYQTGDLPRRAQGEQERRFNASEFAMATADTILTKGIPPSDLSITHFLGSFDYAVYRLPSGRAGFWVDNQTERASASHLAGRFRNRGYTQSLEEEVEKNHQLADEPLSMILAPSGGYRIISVLKVKSREQTTSSEGGGTMEQTFTWSERDFGCLPSWLPWPVYKPLLDIRTWPDFAKYTGD